jgi:anti-anti-sigma regulatory factor
MNNSIAFQQFIEHLREKNYRTYVFDLSQCDGFDSTFMGIVLGVSLARKRVVVINATPAHRKILAEVGIDRVVRLLDGALRLPAVPFQKLEQKAAGSEERIRMILEAHENLVRLDERNEHAFGGFLRAIRGELRRNQE